MEISIEYKGSVFGYKEGSVKGYWYCIRGKIPGTLSGSSVGMIVPTSLAIELSAFAVRTGVVSKDFFKKKTKEKNEVEKTEVKKKKEKKIQNAKPGFNPFENKELESFKDKVKSGAAKKKSLESNTDLVKLSFPDEEEKTLENLLEEIESGEL